MWIYPVINKYHLTKQMIPKIIHYCWFGRGQKPIQALDCIASWKKHLPDYKIKEWNEDSFDVHCNRYVSEAYQSKKYAFVSDYARLYALFREGGIYMDTDVEVLSSFDPFLHHHAFACFENSGYVQTGVMAAGKDSVWMKEWLGLYDCRTFILPDGSVDVTTNTEVLYGYMLSKRLIFNNTFQEIDNLATIYPSDYFCPKDHGTGLIHLTRNTVCIHHFAGSWLIHKSISYRLHLLKNRLIRLFGAQLVLGVVNALNLAKLKQKLLK